MGEMAELSLMSEDETRYEEPDCLGAKRSGIYGFPGLLHEETTYIEPTTGGMKKMDEPTAAQIPLLSAQDIECRIQSISKSKSGTVGAILLLYKDARVDMRILDMVYGSGNWQRTHEVINGNLFCNIDVWDEPKQRWVRKQDVGVESNTEKEKGQASDAFKRAATNVGIGRELYTGPLIYVELADNEYRSEASGSKEVFKAYPSTRFSVSHISYDDRREISELIITDKHGNVRFEMGKRVSSPAQSPPPAQTSMYPQATPPPSNTATKPAATQASTALTCQACGSTITQSERDYSTSKYNRALCRTCQKKR